MSIVNISYEAFNDGMFYHIKVNVHLNDRNLFLIIMIVQKH
jgi:hypothetical protein